MKVYTKIPIVGRYEPPILNAASRIAAQANVTPQELRTRVVRITLIFTTGVLICIGTLFAIRAGLPHTEPERLLAMLLLFGSVLLSIGSVLGVLLVLWSYCVAQYVRNLEARAQIMESTELVDQFVGLPLDPEFRREVARLIADQLQQLPSTRMDNGGTTVVVSVAESLVDQPIFSQKLFELTCRALTRKTSNPELIEEIRTNRLVHVHV